MFCCILFKCLLLIVVLDVISGNPIPPIYNHSTGYFGPGDFYINPGMGHTECFPNAPDYTRMQCSDGTNIPIYRTINEGSRLFLYGYSHATGHHYTWAVERTDSLLHAHQPAFQQSSQNFYQTTPISPSPIGHLSYQALPFTSSADTSTTTDSPKSHDSASDGHQQTTMPKENPKPQAFDYDSDDSLEIILDEAVANGYQPEWYRASMHHQKTHVIDTKDDVKPMLDVASDIDMSNDINELETRLETLYLEGSGPSLYSSSVDQLFPMKLKAKKSKQTKTHSEHSSSDLKQKSMNRKEKEKELKEQKRLKKAAELAQATELRKQQEAIIKERERDEYIKRASEQLLQLEDAKKIEQAKRAEQNAVEVPPLSIGKAKEQSSPLETNNDELMMTEKVNYNVQHNQETHSEKASEANDEFEIVPLVPDISLYLSKIMKGDTFSILKKFFGHAKRELPRSFTSPEEMEHVLDIMEDGRDERALKINAFIAPYYAVRALINDDLDISNSMLEKVVNFTQYLDIRYEEIKKRKEKVKTKPLFIYLKDYHADSKGVKKLRALLRELKPQLEVLNRTIPFSVSMLAKYKELQYRYGEDEMDQKFTMMSSLRVQVKITYEFLQKLNMFYEGFKGT